MTTTSEPLRPDPTRTGAVWVTGTGAFLLLAAAAVFTAVRWDDIPAGAKLAALGLATGAFLIAGRRLATELPATASALFHLGTFLVPVDVAAVCLRLQLPWSTVLLAHGLVATVTFGWAARVEGSVVLRWSAAAAVVLLAVGLGATTPLPAPLVLAVAGAAAAARRAHGPAVAWASVAGLAPLVTLLQSDLTKGAGVLDQLGLALGQPIGTALAAVLAAATLGQCAVVRSRRQDEDARSHGGDEDVAAGLALLSALPLALAATAAALHLGVATWPLVALAAALTSLAAWLDRGLPLGGTISLGTLVRAGTVGVLAGTAGLPAADLGLVAATAAILTAVDAGRLRQPQLAYGTALALPVAIGALLHTSGLSLPATGVALAVAAVVVVGLGSLLDRSWWGPLGTATTLLCGSALALALPEASAVAHVLLLTGGVVTAIGVSVRQVEVQIGGGLVMAVGFWMRLAAAGIDASEAYVLPVAVLLAVVGTKALAEGTASSWVAYGPAIALLGGTAFAERVQGGAGWHGIVAGTVGVAAVIAGGGRRLAAPLLLGTGLLVAIAGYESLAVTAQLPTWTWLAVGGSALLAAGVTMERHEVGPLETGRRLVDVVAERYR